MFTISAPNRLRQLFVSIWAGSLLCGIVHGQFSTVLNVPPDFPVNGIEAGTQLNVFKNGLIPSPFKVGSTTAANENLEVNVRGGVLLGDIDVFGGVVSMESGLIGTGLTMWPGSELNMSGGLIESGFIADGAAMNIRGGKIEDGLRLRDDARLSIQGGEVGEVLGTFGSLIELTDGSLASFSLFDSDLTMTGGSFGDVSAAYNADITISGGRMGNQLKVGANSDLVISGGGIGHDIDLLSGSLRLVGSDFRLNGQLVEGFDAQINSVNVGIPRDYWLSGTLLDGTPFLMSSQRGSNLLDGTVVLESAEPMPVDPATYIVSGETSLLGVGRGQTVKVVSGGTLRQNFYAGTGGRLTVRNGGAVSDGLSAVGADVHVDGGIVGNNLHAYGASNIHITDGQIGRDFLATDGANVTIDGGSIGIGFTVERGIVSLNGGEVRENFYASESQLTVSGGVVRYQLTTDDSDIVVTGGLVPWLDVRSGTQMISGGEIGDLWLNGEAVSNFRGGRVGRLLFIGVGATATIEGGRIRDVFFREEAAVSVVGGEFAVDGVMVEGLANAGDLQSVTVPANGTLTGVLSDGIPFRWTPTGRDFDSFAFELRASELPPIQPEEIVTPDQSVPLGIRDGQLVRVKDGGHVPNLFIAADGSTVEVEQGGSVGDQVELAGATLNSIGSIGSGLRAFGSTLDVQGTLGGDAVLEASTVTLKNATVGNGVDDVHILASSRLDADATRIGSLHVIDSQATLRNGTRVHDLTVDGTGALPVSVSVDDSHVLNALELNHGSLFLNSVTVGSEARHLEVLGIYVRNGTAEIVDSTVFQGFFIGEGNFVSVDSKVLGYSRVREGGTLNIIGGEIETLDVRTNGMVTLQDGRLRTSELWDGAKLTMLGGHLDQLSVRNGGTAEIHAGNVGDDVFFDSGSKVSLSGGKYGPIRTGQSPERLAFVGRDFRLDGVAVEGLGLPGSEGTVELDFGSVFSGIFANGTPFAFSRQDADVLPRSVTIVSSEPVLPGPDRIVASIDELPEGLSGGMLVVDRGGELPENFGAGFGTEVAIQDGGIVGANFEAVGASVTIDGGIIGAGFDAFVDSHVTISGGLIGGEFSAHAGSVVELIGDQFLLDGVPVDGLASLGDSLVLDNRAGLLTGQLADGMPFDFELNTATFISDLFHPDATLRLTLAESVLNCDFDNDGECLLADMDALVTALGSADHEFDLDGSGAVDGEDVSAWLFKAGALNISRPYSDGDATLDGIVDQADLNILGLNWQAEVSGWSNGDFNGDGIVDAMDLSRVGENWQTEGASSAAVPEPTGRLMMFFGLVVLLLGRRTVKQLG